MSRQHGNVIQSTVGASRAQHQLEPGFSLRPCRKSHRSGFSWEQVHLCCTEGSLEWMDPARVLCVILEPSLSSARHTTVCIKPPSDFQGASIYVERTGQLHLVASPQRDISCRTASFQYELLSNQSAAGPDFKKMALVQVLLD